MTQADIHGHGDDMWPEVVKTGMYKNELEKLFFDKGLTLAYREIKDELQALITQQCNQARLDELSKIESAPDSLVWTVGNDPDMAITIEERIKELEETEV